MVRAEARWSMRHSKHMHRCSLYSLMYLDTLDSQPGAHIPRGYSVRCRGMWNEEEIDIMT